MHCLGCYRFTLFAIFVLSHSPSRFMSCFGAILRVGNPLKWAASKPHLNNVRVSGAKQFLNHYLRSKTIETPLFLWGDEIEYGIFSRRPDSKSEVSHFDLALGRGTEIREFLSSLEKNMSSSGIGCVWQPEYGSWMVETVPRDPYAGYISDLLQVEKSMQWRRKRLHFALKDNEIAPSLSNFPMLGVTGQGYTHADPSRTHGPIANSKFISDAAINPHPRMQALTQNIRSRRGSNVCIQLPIDMTECSTPSEANSKTAPAQEYLAMDAMSFGMGCCCLQVTLQCKSDGESRFLHDQLTTFAPLMLALSAATPVFQGRLLGTDTRWQAISDAVDDRTPAERGVDGESRVGLAGSNQGDSQLVGNGVRRLLKSRYSSVSRYIKESSCVDESKALDRLNDVDAGIDEDILQMMLQGGLDWSLACHIAHLFTRDPLVIFDDAIALDDQRVMDHFENIQSTNWRTMRWKPPAVAMGLAAADLSKKGAKSTSTDLQSYGPGWRVEFRPLEVQLTDFENAAFSIVVVLLSRAILAMNYNFYLPMSLVDENMRRAQLKDAAVNQKFWIRRRALDPASAIPRSVPLEDAVSKEAYVELSLDEIFNGQQATSEHAGFPGLVPAVIGYLETIGCSEVTVGRLQPYFTLLSRRAKGTLPTAASWMRKVLKSHPSYQHDGRVTPEMTDSLLSLAEDIGMGRASQQVTQCLVGDAHIERLCPSDDATDPYLGTEGISSSTHQKSSESADLARKAPCCSYVPVNSCGTSTSVLSNSGIWSDNYLDIMECA